MKQIFPFLNWLIGYKKGWLFSDLSAGITVGIMLIPQGMAYAMLAGVPPIFGLYASTLPLIIYAIFGTSRQLAVGPVAIDSILVLSSIVAFAEVGSEHYIELAILLAFVEGCILLLFGFLRLGFIVNFLSKPVITGFLAAAAIVIGVSQLRHLLGVDISASANVVKTINLLLLTFDNWSYTSICIGLSGVLLLVFIPKLNKKIPTALLVLIISILIVYGLDLNSDGLKIVGDIPEGLPNFKLPNFSLDVIKKLLPSAFTIALIAFTEAISVSKAIESKYKNYKIIPNQELIALGLANIIGSMFQSFSVTAGLGRTAVNNKAGAKTNLATFVSALVVILTLLFLTPLFYYLPTAILASIILVAVISLLDIKYIQYLWKTDKREFFLLLSTFFATLIFGIINGILIGVLLSIMLVIYRVANPHIAELGVIPGTNYYKNLLRFKDANEIEGLLIIRFDAQLFFANCNVFKDTLILWAEKKPNLKKILIDAQPLNHIDATALYLLIDLVNYFNKNEIEVVFAGVKGPVRDVFRKAELLKSLGDNKFFMNVQEAVEYHSKHCIAAQKSD